MASASFSHHDPQQHAAINSVLIAIFRAAKTAQRGAKDWDYAPSDTINSYLDYMYEQLPRLMSEDASGCIIPASYKRTTGQNMDTYYGRAWKGAWWQEDDDRKRWRLIELNKHLIEGVSEPETHSRVRNGYKKYDDAAGNSETSVRFRRYTFGNNPPLPPSRLLYDISPIAKPTGPVPRGPRQQIEASRSPKAPRILVPRGPARCSWTSLETIRPKQTPVEDVPPASQPPPFIKEGTEEGELIELVKSTPDKSSLDVMSRLEMRLDISITDEYWEDLFKCDV
ncbi:uncharacterized protein N0V89_007021 [Didymosphaeria variabile]|uniref:Uncharacterized protein n=1 Tax=Didymosphaeria variabile TaxID=1932322 RepID=A0A9W8XK96_9PLEO|nr:uncharacterized protein N0V89_007021 [Didymosphaeria variabile]KAJ4351678.1 hypothetical protein N0V89_007021 [Didymosphaeria variabile]